MPNWGNLNNGTSDSNKGALSEINTKQQSFTNPLITIKEYL